MPVASTSSTQASVLDAANDPEPPYEVHSVGAHKLALGDCLDVMEDIADECVDLILADLPYGVTQCKWDSVIPTDALWQSYNRIIKPGRAIILTASQPFTTTLIVSNREGFCYSLVWNKRFAANFVQAKRMPLRIHEDILVFSKDGKAPAITRS